MPYAAFILGIMSSSDLQSKSWDEKALLVNDTTDSLPR